MSVAERILGCFDQRSLSCTRLQQLSVNYAELSAALCALGESSYVFYHGREGCSATWSGVLTRLLATKSNRGPVFAALRDVCGIVLTLCPALREASDTTRLLIIFVAIAMRHKASQDDVDFFLMVLREIAARTGCPEVATNVHMFISLYFE